MARGKSSSERARFEILVEELKSEFRHVTEKVVALDGKIDREIGALRASLEQRITLLETAVTELSRDMRKQFGEVHQRFGKMDEQFDGVRRDLKQLEQRLEVHERAHT